MDISLIGTFDSLGNVLSGHPYLYTFIALLFAGESVLLPVMFLALQGTLDMTYVFLVGIAATVISDSFWYWLGRKFPPSIYNRFVGQKTETVMAKLEWLFTTKGPQTLILSKFVYGTRIAAQVLSGIHKMPFATYTISNCAGVLMLMVTLVSIGYSVQGTIAQFDEAVNVVAGMFLAFVVVAVGVHLVVGRILKKKWFQ